jgi:hypothetical protein
MCSMAQFFWLSRRSTMSIAGLMSL